MTQIPICLPRDAAMGFVFCDLFGFWILEFGIFSPPGCLPGPISPLAGLTEIKNDYFLA